MGTKNDYDVIIIGTGLGGLIAGAYLAKFGFSVLLCEQHTQPGGYFTSFTRQGFTFDGGIQAVEDCGMLFNVLRDIGVLNRIEFKPSTFAFATPEKFYSYNTVDEAIEYYKDLIKIYPQEEKGLKQIYDDAKKCCGVMEAFTKLPNPIFVPFIEVIKQYPAWRKKYDKERRHLKEFFKMMDLPLDDYLNKLLKDPDLKNLLRQTMYANSPASFMLSFHYFVKDYFHPQGGFQKMSDVLADFIEENGGEIRYRTLVDEILYEEKRACGVLLLGGEEIRSKYVLSNSDMRRTFLKMLPPEATPKSYRKMLEDTPVSDSNVTIFLGLDMPVEELPLKGHQHVYYVPQLKGLDPFENFGNEDYFSSSPIELSVTSFNDPELAPPGKTALVIQTITFMGYGSGWKSSDGKRTEDYNKFKEKIADQMIASAEQLIPGLREKIVFRSVATPLTNERYTLNSEGATAGWTYDPSKAFNSGKKGVWGFKTPVKNLYLVGHWTMSPGGAPACFMSGKMVSTILKWKKRLRLGI